MTDNPAHHPLTAEYSIEMFQGGRRAFSLYKKSVKKRLRHREYELRSIENERGKEIWLAGWHAMEEWEWRVLYKSKVPGAAAEKSSDDPTTVAYGLRMLELGHIASRANEPLENSEGIEHQRGKDIWRTGWHQEKINLRNKAEYEARAAAYWAAAKKTARDKTRVIFLGTLGGGLLISLLIGNLFWGFVMSYFVWLLLDMSIHKRPTIIESFADMIADRINRRQR